MHVFSLRCGAWRCIARTAVPLSRAPIGAVPVVVGVPRPVGPVPIIPPRVALRCSAGIGPRCCQIRLDARSFQKQHRSRCLGAMRCRATLRSPSLRVRHISSSDSDQGRIRLLQMQMPDVGHCCAVRTWRTPWCLLNVGSSQLVSVISFLHLSLINNG